MLVAESARSTIMGFAVIRGEQLELEHLYVDSTAYGTGLAAQLLEASEQALAGRGCTTAQLVVAWQNKRAISFYEKHGWRKSSDQSRPSAGTVWGMESDRLDLALSESERRATSMPCWRYTKRIART